MRQNETKKGHRLRLSDGYDVFITAAALFGFFLVPLVLIYGQSLMKLSETEKLKMGGLLLGSSSLLVFVGVSLLYRFIPFFKNKRDIRLVLHYLLSNNFYETVHRQNGKGEKLKLSPVYVKKVDYATLAVTVEMAGKVMRELDKIPSDLEKLFFADFKEKQDFKAQGLFSKHAYSQFLFSDNKEAQRLPISELSYDKKKGIRLMDGAYWDFVHAPHLLIAGGTGGGKTIFLLALLKVLAGFSLVEICDPKKSDLSVLGNFKVFEGHVASEIEDIMACLTEAVNFMEDRYRKMGVDSEHPEDVKIGNNFQSYGFPPKFILVDEWTAFYASLDIRKASQVDDLMAQLILKGRQAGIFLIVAMQRPDAEYLSANLRDNMMARISLGKLSKSGYRMIFGEDYEDKNYLYIKSKIGRGYAALDGDMPSEFFSPLIPFEKGFSFEAIFMKMKPLKATSSQTTLDIKKAKTVEGRYTISSLAKALERSATTVTRLMTYLSEAGYDFTEGAGQYNLLDKAMLEDIIAYKTAQPTVSWKEAVQTVMERRNE